MKKNRLLIIGSNSFIAKNLLSHNRLKKYDLYLISRKKNKNSNLKNFYKLDLSKKKKIENVIKIINPNYIIHLADTKNKKNLKIKPVSNKNINLIFAKNIISACIKLDNLKKFIFLGSCDEYGNNNFFVNEKSNPRPVKYYGRYKLKITNEILKAKKKHNLPIIVLRPSVVYGPGQDNNMFIPTMIRCYKTKKILKMGLGNQYRDFLYIDDLITGIIKTLICKNLKMHNDIFNLSYGKSHKVIEVVEIFRKLIKTRKNDHLFTKVNPKMKDLCTYYFIDNKKARLQLGWVPKTKLKQGLVRILKYEK